MFKSEKLKKLKTDVLCKTDEEYFLLKFGCIKILDAFRFFTPYSLEYMGQTLKSENCKILNAHNLKNLKGIYPYEYIKGNNFQDIINIMNETELPFSSVESMLNYAESKNLDLGAIGLIYEKCQSGLEEVEVVYKMKHIVDIIENIVSICFIFDEVSERQQRFENWVKL